MSGVDPDFQLARIHGNLVAMRDLPSGRYSECLLGPHQCQEIILLLEHLACRASDAERDLAQRTAERDEARRRICNDSLRMGRVFRRIEWQYFECSTPQDVAEMMGWDCFDAPHTNATDVPVQDGGVA